MLRYKSSRGDSRDPIAADLDCVGVACTGRGAEDIESAEYKKQEVTGPRRL